MTSKHQRYLDTHCRVCTKSLGRVNYACKYNQSLMSSIGIDPTSEDATVQPSKYCHCCHVKLTSASKISPIKWKLHSDESCLVCDVYCKGGRPKKRCSTGRPTLLQSHIKSAAAATPHFTLSQIADKRCVANVTCCSCNSVLNGSIELMPCKTLLCSSCCTLLAVSPSFNCPGCLCQHHSTTDTFTKPSSLIKKMINEMRVVCKKCSSMVNLELLTQDCSLHQKAASKETQSNNKMAIKVVSQLIKDSDGSTITVSTGDRVSIATAIHYNAIYH